MNNPLDFIRMIKNPKEYVMNMARQQNNPMLNNLIKMAESGNTKELENFARNMMKEQGKNFDEQYNQLKSLIK